MPTNDLALWLDGDVGVTAEATGEVSAWANQAPGATDSAVQANFLSQPVWDAAGGPLGRGVLCFDGIDDFLGFELDLNGLTQATLVLVSAHANPSQTVQFNEVQHAALFWDEAASWGTAHLNPLQDTVHWRLGTTEPGNTPSADPPVAAGAAYTVCIAVKNGLDEKLYVNGELVGQRTGTAGFEALSGLSTVGWLGRGFQDTYFAGKIAEVLVYTSALSDLERQQLETYLGMQSAVARDDHYATPADADLVMNVRTGVLGNDAISGAGAFTVNLLSDVTNGTLSLAADGSFAYTPSAGFGGVDSFTYEATNGAETTNAATAFIRVLNTAAAAPRIVTGQTSFALREVIDSQADLAHVALAADLSGDGLPDMIATSEARDQVIWYENNGDGSFTKIVLDAGLESAYPAEIGDLDQDGDNDILASGYRGDIHVWYENDGFGDFGAAQLIGATDGPHSLQVIDLDQDGNRDVVTSSQDAGLVEWYRNDGSENFTAQPIGAVGQAKRAEAVDIDGDSALDVLSISFSQDEVAWWKNDGAQGFTKNVITSGADGGYYVIAADIDGDSVPDVLTASQLDDTIAWYANDGAGNFTTNIIDTAMDATRSVHASDIDGDGDIDALAASVDGNTVAWYENNGSGVFTKRPVDNAVPGAYGISAFDMDLDGDCDVLSAGRNSGEISIHPQVREHSLNVANGGTVVIDTSALESVDADDSPEGLTYTILLAPTAGELRLDGNPVAVGGSFTQADVNGGLVGYTHDGSGSLADGFSFEVADGGESGLKSPRGTFDVTIGNGGNQNPIAVDDGYATPQDTPLAAMSVLSNDSDPDSDPLTGVLETDVSNGILTLSPDGTFSYTPSPGFIGIDSFTYRASDGSLSSSPATVTITVVADMQDPGAPPTLSAFAVSGSQIDLAWGAATDNVGVTAYKVLLDSVEIDTVPGSRTTFAHTGLTLSTAYGPYEVVACDAAGNQSPPSPQASATTLDGPPAPGVPTNDLALWLDGDVGVTAEATGEVSAWANQAPGATDSAVQANFLSQPVWDAAGGPLGRGVLCFDGIDDFLGFELDLNGLTQATLVLVSAHANPSQTVQFNEVQHAALFWDETASWGTAHLNPLQDTVHWRFGTTEPGNTPSADPPVAAGAAYTVCIAVKNGLDEKLYVNGESVGQRTGTAGFEALSGLSTVGWLGRGFQDTYFAGKIAEVLVYTSALSDLERQQLESYLLIKYFAADCPIQITGIERVSPTQFSIDWSGNSGFFYQLETSLQLDGTDWTPAGDRFEAISTSGALPIDVGPSPPGAWFFRLRKD